MLLFLGEEGRIACKCQAVCDSALSLLADLKVGESWESLLPWSVLEFSAAGFKMDQTFSPLISFQVFLLTRDPPRKFRWSEEVPSLPTIVLFCSCFSSCSSNSPKVNFFDFFFGAP